MSHLIVTVGLDGTTLTDRPTRFTPSTDYTHQLYYNVLLTYLLTHCVTVTEARFRWCGGACRGRQVLSSPLRSSTPRSCLPEVSEHLESTVSVPFVRLLVYLNLKLYVKLSFK